ncbi:YciI family protein [Roseateles sp. NT4]|uniref:YciI family protein n=1 Tax=Roseateles sp. NT4 TaxID=3453715 RepID=UPI003EF07A82
MKFMILVKSNPGLERRLAEMSDADMKASMTEMEAFNDELRKAGVMKDCDGLRPSRDGKRVRFAGAQRSAVDGPFEGDLVAGYWIWELPNMADAVAWVKRCPNPMPEPSEIEIRPFWVMDAGG